MDFQRITSSNQENPLIGPIQNHHHVKPLANSGSNYGSVRKPAFGENKKNFEQSSLSSILCTPNAGNRLKFGNLSNTPLTAANINQSSTLKPSLKQTNGSIKKAVKKIPDSTELPIIHEEIEIAEPLTKDELSEQNHPSEILQFIFSPEEMQKFLDAPAQTDDEDDDDENIPSDDDDYFCGLL